MNQNGGIHKGGFAVLCHRNGGSESPGILSYFRESNKAYAPDPALITLKQGERITY